MLDLGTCLLILVVIFLIYNYCDCAKLKDAAIAAKTLVTGENMSGPAWSQSNLVAFENADPKVYASTLARRESLRSAADSARD